MENPVCKEMMINALNTFGAGYEHPVYVTVCSKSGLIGLKKYNYGYAAVYGGDVIIVDFDIKNQEHARYTIPKDKIMILDMGIGVNFRAKAMRDGKEVTLEVAIPDNVRKTDLDDQKANGQAFLKAVR